MTSATAAGDQLGAHPGCHSGGHDQAAQQQPMKIRRSIAIALGINVHGWRRPGARSFGGGCAGWFHLDTGSIRAARPGTKTIKGSASIDSRPATTLHAKRDVDCHAHAHESEPGVGPEKR